MAQVTEAIVEATWKRLGAATPAEVAKMQRRYGNTQPELVAFVMAFTADEREDVIGVALYTFFAVLEMFRLATPRKLRRIKRKEVEAAWEANCEVLAQLETGDVSDIPTPIVAEPHVLQYVVDAMAEPDVEEEVALSAEESASIFLVLKTVIDCLHKA